MQRVHVIITLIPEFRQPPIPIQTHRSARDTRAGVYDVYVRLFQAEQGS